MENSIVSKYQVPVGFVKGTRKMNNIFGWITYLLLWLWMGKKPKYRHCFMCLDGLCFDLSHDGIQMWDYADTRDDVLEDTDFLHFEIDHDLRDLAYFMHGLGLRIHWSDVIRAFLTREVESAFCASFVGHMLSLDVPLTITVDELYSLLNAMPGELWEQEIF